MIYYAFIIVFNLFTLHLLLYVFNLHLLYIVFTLHLLLYLIFIYYSFGHNWH